MRQLTKKQIICDGLEGIRNISQEHKGVVSKFGKNKNGSKGKSTFSLLVPKQENLFQPKSSKKRKAPSHTTIMEKKNSNNTLSKPKTLVLDSRAPNVPSPRKQ
jgi:hypothetical protein